MNQDLAPILATARELYGRVVWTHMYDLVVGAILQRLKKVAALFSRTAVPDLGSTKKNERFGAAKLSG